MHDGNFERETNYLSNSSTSTANTVQDASMVAAVAQIVSSYVGHNQTDAAQIPTLIEKVHASLAALSRTQAPAVRRAPAVSVKKSLTKEHIVCLEDGRKFKSLKRHLRTQYDMTPEQYRAKWGLPDDYPMVAPGYAQKRSDLAKNQGLGNFGRLRGRKGSTKSPP
jgi:predicted transcriptional regulator